MVSKSLHVILLDHQLKYALKVSVTFSVIVVERQIQELTKRHSHLQGCSCSLWIFFNKLKIATGLETKGDTVLLVYGLFFP